MTKDQLRAIAEDALRAAAKNVSGLEKQAIEAEPPWSVTEAMALTQLQIAHACACLMLADHS